MWLAFCLVSTLASGLIAIPAKKCAEKNENMTRVNILAMISYHILFLFIISFSNPDIILNFKPAYFFNIFPLALLQTLGAVCYYMSLKYTLVSTASLITRCKVLIPLVLGIVILGEKLNGVQIVLSITLVLSTIFISSEGKSCGKSDIKGIIYAYGFVILSGVVNFLNKIYVNAYGDPLVVLYYVAITVILGLLFFCFFTKKMDCLNIKKINGKWFFLSYITLDVMSSLLNRFSLIDGPVSLIYVIESSSIIITILASYFILKEKITLKKAIIISLGVICVIGLAIFS